MNRMRTRALTMILLLAAAACVVTCQKKESNPAGPDDNGIPQDVARISGSVRDADGNPLSDAALHVIYDFPDVASAAHLDVPSTTGFFNLSQVLYTECGGTEPIPDGVMIKLFWDTDSDGPDDTDPQPPLCEDPPECERGPNQTVNFNEFAFNGVEIGFGPGLFSNFPLLFSTYGDVLSPNRFYARVYCADGNVLYTSQAVDVPPDYSEQELHFTCTPCEGAPVIPAWSLDPLCPNPAWDTLIVHYNLRETAEVRITLRSFRGGAGEELLHSRLGSGGHVLRTALGSRANGLYEVTLSSPAYQEQRLAVRNVSDRDRLRIMDGAAYSSSDGAFTFDAAAGTAMDLRYVNCGSRGQFALARLSVSAIKLGYQYADTTFNVAGGQSYEVNLTLRPE